MDESPLANSPAKPPLPCSRSPAPPNPKHIHSTWCPTQGLLSLSTLLKWEGAPMGDPQNLPRTSPSRWQVGQWGKDPGCSPWAGPWLPLQLLNQGVEGVSEIYGMSG